MKSRVHAGVLVNDDRSFSKKKACNKMHHRVHGRTVIFSNMLPRLIFTCGTWLSLHVEKGGMGWSQAPTPFGMCWLQLDF